MTRATQVYDRGKRLVIPDWEIILKLAVMIKMKDVNAHAQRKEEAPKEITCSHSGAASTAHLSYPECALKDPLENDVEETHAGGEGAGDVLLMMCRLDFPSSLFHCSLGCQTLLL